MRVLGVETSCDETAAALFDAPRLARRRVFSQDAAHRPYGGVVPEVASRDHIRRLLPMIDEVLQGEAPPDAIAYTRGPGLAGALLVGAACAVALARGFDAPAVGVHHLEGHLLSPFLTADDDFDFPYLALLASGGHTQLWRARAHRRYDLLGETRDDAAGEALDKIAALMDLGYPGGAALEAAARGGDPARFNLPQALPDAPDFSFSGLKTAARRLIERAAPADYPDIAAAAQRAAFAALAAKAARAVAEKNAPRTLAVVGGVSRNLALRATMDAAVAEAGGRTVYPPPEFCADNAAMIALAGAWALRESGADAGYGFEIKPRWDLRELCRA